MKRTVLSLLLVVALTACDDGGATGRGTIGPEGGTLWGDGVQIDVPAGALARDLEIRVEPITVPAGYQAVGATAFRFQPEGLRFDAPVTVRFDVSPEQGDVTVFWSRDDAPDVLEALPTRRTGSGVVATIEHFSTGLAGWLESEDAGPADPDAGLEDAGVDSGDADGGPADAGLDGGPDSGHLPGITCVVQRRNTDCTAMPPTTNENVPFSYLSESGYGPVGALTSSLSAFNTLYNLAPGEQPRFAATDAAGSRYIVGSGDEPNAIRVGSVLTVDIDESRGGGACTESTVPLITIRCTGSTMLEDPACPLSDVIDPSPLSCSVSRRDAACVGTTTTEMPAFWLASGIHGADSELRTTSPGIAAVFGSAGEATFYREGACSTFTPDARPYGVVQRIELSDGQVISYGFGGSSAATCTDDRDVSRPLVQLSCYGVTSLGAPR